MDLFIAPHNDDDALFGAYTCLQHRPLIVTVLRSFIESGWNPPVHYETREAESAAAAAVLGCEHVQWTFPDSNPDWHAISAELSTLTPRMVWAPLPEPGGHAHHNVLGTLAGNLWPHTHYYATYTHANGKTTTGRRIEPQPGWETVKREAMACYHSQATHPQCRVAFTEWSIDEYLS